MYPVRVKTYVEFVWDRNVLRFLGQEFENIKDFSEYAVNSASDALLMAIEDGSIGSIIKVDFLDENQ